MDKEVYFGKAQKKSKNKEYSAKVGNDRPKWPSPLPTEKYQMKME